MTTEQLIEQLEAAYMRDGNSVTVDAAFKLAKAFAVSELEKILFPDMKDGYSPGHSTYNEGCYWAYRDIRKQIDLAIKALSE